MRITDHASRLSELAIAGVVGALVMTTGSPFADGGRRAQPDSASAVQLSTGAEVVFELRPAPTLLDSLRAESSLPGAEVRRPIELLLGHYSDDRLLVRRISRAVVRESRRQQVPPSLITAVLLTENTTLRPEAESPVGAQGLMQVMPFHAGAKLCNSSDLVDVDSNICHGTLILARSLRTSGSSTTALLRYNGCVRGTNTPDCRRYPAQVLARAGRVRRAILASVNPVSIADASAGPGPQVVRQ